MFSHEPYRTDITTQSQTPTHTSAQKDRATKPHPHQLRRAAYWHEAEESVVAVMCKFDHTP
eukprot:2225644-Rhodomonas_salina.2